MVSAQAYLELLDQYQRLGEAALELCRWCDRSHHPNKTKLRTLVNNVRKALSNEPE